MLPFHHPPPATRGRRVKAAELSVGFKQCRRALEPRGLAGKQGGNTHQRNWKHTLPNLVKSPKLAADFRLRGWERVPSGGRGLRHEAEDSSLGSRCFPEGSDRKHMALNPAFKVTLYCLIN